jgi:succinate dehydrogenase / fumarate reductase, cytochrome b subunit
MKLCDRFFNSPVGSKFLVAITGLMLTGFVLAHLSGNLLIFAGAETFNAYAKGLHSLGALLWVARLGLLGAFVLHLYLAIKLSIENRSARPVNYAHEATMQASLASRHMIHTGILMLTFIIYHLAHYTFRVVGSDIKSIPSEDVYAMVVTGFSSPGVSIFYVISMAALAAHLSHGVSSVFQTLGAYHSNINPVTRKLGPIVAIIVFFGFSSIPLAVLTGLVK